MHTDSSHRDGDPIIEQKISSSSSSSSSESVDPLLDLDDDDKKDILENSNPITKNGQESPSSPKSVVESPAEWSMISASPRAGPGSLSPPEHSPQTPEWSMIDASPKQSPPTQTMGRPDDGYDPNRIPSSIFTAKPTTPTDWSVASNESLFSIYMGNNSFSKDHAILLDFRSGELTKPDESNKSPSGLPTVMEVAAENPRKSDSMLEDSGEKETAHKPTKVIMKETAEDHGKESVSPTEGIGFSIRSSKLSGGGEIHHADGARTSASTPRISFDSANSSKSFAFPVFAGEAGRSGLAKVAPNNFQSNPPAKLQPQPQPQPQAQMVPPKPAETRWFSCFSCCSLSCCC